MDYLIFRNNVLAIRTSLGITAKELAEKCNLKHHKRVYEIEEGRVNPKLEDVIAICKHLNQPIDKMLNERVQIIIQFKREQQ